MHYINKITLVTRHVNFITVFICFLVPAYSVPVNAELLPSRVPISAEPAANVSRAVVYLEAFDKAAENFIKVDKQPAVLKQPVDFLREYYRVGRAGDLQGLLQLHSPEMREDAKEALNRSGGLKPQSGPLPGVRGREVIFWGDYREVNVELQREVNSDQWFSHTHMFKCSQSGCLFVRDSEWDRLGFHVGYLYVKGNRIPAAAPKSTYVPIQLHPKQPGVNSFPIELDLIPVGNDTGIELDNLFKRFVAAVNETSPALRSKKLPELFDAGVPDQYSHMVSIAGSAIAPDYSWEAFVRHVQSKKDWKQVLAFSVTHADVVYVARSGDGENFFFPMRKIDGHWRLLTRDYDAPWASIMQTRAFVQAVSALPVR